MYIYIYQSGGKNGDLPWVESVKNHQIKTIESSLWGGYWTYPLVTNMTNWKTHPFSNRKYIFNSNGPFSIAIP